MLQMARHRGGGTRRCSVRQFHNEELTGPPFREGVFGRGTRWQQRLPRARRRLRRRRRYGRKS